MDVNKVIKWLIAVILTLFILHFLIGSVVIYKRLQKQEQERTTILKRLGY